MNILIVSEAWEPQVNGVVRTYQNLKREMVAMGHEVTVLSPRDFAINFPCPTYPDIRLCAPLPGEVERKIGKAQFDHIHIATEGPLGRAVNKYCRKNDIAFTSSYHTDFPNYIAQRAPILKKEFHDATERWIRAFHNASSSIMLVSDKMDDYLRGIGVTAPMQRLTRGVDTNVFHPGPSPLFQNEGPVALYVGRVSLEKNIEAFLNLKIPHKKVVVGAGPQLEDLRKKYPDAVFTGLKEGKDLADHYRAAEIVVFPSKTDTFGIVLIEGLACGKPIAAFDEGGHTVILNNDPKMGALNKDLATAFNEAANSTGTAEERFAYVRENYSWEKAAKQFLGLAP